MESFQSASQPCTLVPTTWFREFRRGGGARSRPVEAQLREHARQVEEMLRAARRLGPVAVVTLARPNWLAATAEVCLPGLNITSLLNELEIQVYYDQNVGPEMRQVEVGQGGVQAWFSWRSLLR